MSRKAWNRSPDLEAIEQDLRLNLSNKELRTKYNKTKSAIEGIRWRLKQKLNPTFQSFRQPWTPGTTKPKDLTNV